MSPAKRQSEPELELEEELTPATGTSPKLLEALRLPPTQWEREIANHFNARCKSLAERTSVLEERNRLADEEARKLKAKWEGRQWSIARTIIIATIGFLALYTITRLAWVPAPLRPSTVEAPR